MRLSRTGLGRLGLGLVAWAVIVALGSWLVWLVVSDAGRDVVGSTLPRGAAPSAATSPTPPPVPPTPPPVTPASPPASPPASSTAAPASPAAPGPTAATTPSTQSGQVTRTWTGAAGVVTTRCTGSAIALSGAAASADGYVVEVKSRGPREVDVEFEGRGEETVLDTRVRAHCVDGTPHYEVEAED